jgi:hypothetical protein
MMQPANLRHGYHMPRIRRLHRPTLRSVLLQLQLLLFFMFWELLDRYLRAPEGPSIFVRYVRGHRRAARMVHDLNARLTGLDRRNWYELRQA